jgi:hypothetical protein
MITEVNVPATPDSVSKIAFGPPEQPFVFGTYGNVVSNSVSLRAPAHSLNDPLGFIVEDELTLTRLVAATLSEGTDPDCKNPSTCTTSIYTYTWYGMGISLGVGKINIYLRSDPRVMTSFNLSIGTSQKG